MTSRRALLPHFKYHILFFFKTYDLVGNLIRICFSGEISPSERFHTNISCTRIASRIKYRKYILNSQRNYIGFKFETQKKMFETIICNYNVILRINSQMGDGKFRPNKRYPYHYDVSCGLRSLHIV